MSAVETVKAFYQAIAAGNVSGIVATLRADVQWTEAEGFPYYSGTWHSPQEVVDNLLVPLSRDWDGFAAQPSEFIADGDRVVVIGVYSGTYRATGKRMRAAFAHRWTVRDGKIASFDMFTDTALIRAALN